MRKTTPLSIPRTGKLREKSVKLLPTEVQYLRELREKANSHLALARVLRIDRVTLQRIMEKGSGSELNVTKLRKRLEIIQTAA